jgi:hypothetical protein
VSCAEALDDVDAKRQAFAAALSEWSEIEKSMPPEGRAAIERSTDYNTLRCLDGLHRDREFDQLWATLPPDMQNDISLLRLRAFNLRRRGEGDAFLRLVEQARAYHTLDGATNSAELEELISELQRQELKFAPAYLQTEPRPGVRTLLYHFRELVQRSPTEQMEVLDPGRSVGEYLLREHVICGQELVTRKSTIRTLSDENKFNDLFVSLLKMRVAFLHWSVNDQSRGGSTKTKAAVHGGVGERDWVVQQRGLDIAIVEALRLRDSGWRGDIEEHVSKALARYNAPGLPLVFVVAYVEKQPLATLVSDYLDHVQQVIVQDYQLLDVAEFQHPDLVTVANVRVLRARYERGNIEMIAYHILLDFSES